jgi:hypothetical protein
MEHQSLPGAPPDLENASTTRQPADAATCDRLNPMRSSRRWLVAALVVLMLALAATHGSVWRRGPRTLVPTRIIPASSQLSNGQVLSHDSLSALARADALFEAWLVARNAETLVRNPSHLFETEHCAPARNTLTLGVPMITMGILGIPVQLATGDPVLTYNWAIVALALISAFSMYWLVTEWSGIPAAGIVAGLLYAFHPLRLHWIAQPAEWDTSWTVLALFFARRLFARGWWRDATGLVLAIALQMGATFYQFVAAVFLVPPFVLWLPLRYGFSRVSRTQLAFVAIASAIAAIQIYGPYLEARSASPDSLHRSASAFIYAGWSAYLPGGESFLGWPLLGLAFVGLAVGRRRALGGLEPDPRWALFAGALLVAFIAAGNFNDELAHLVWETPPFTIPDPYALLARILPGLDAVRVVFRLSAAVILTLSILAGFGSAALIRSSGRHGTAAAAGLIGFALAAVASPSAFGPSQPEGWDLHDVRADAASVEFFDALTRMGNDGPLLELPYFPGMAWGVNPERILLTAYHHRRTSACFGSFLPPETRTITELSARLPDPAAARELRRLGFTTVVVHLDEPLGLPILKQLITSAGDGKILRWLDSSRSMAAFELLPTREDSKPNGIAVP